jgi:hypothetical protein
MKTRFIRCLLFLSLAGKLEPAGAAKHCKFFCVAFDVDVSLLGERRLLKCSLIVEVCLGSKMDSCLPRANPFCTVQYINPPGLARPLAGYHMTITAALGAV